jgi:hypothetical protein
MGKTSTALSPRPFPGPPPAWLVRLVLKARTSLQRLADRLVPPEVVIFERSTGLGATMVLGSVARLGIADRLAAGPQTAAALAEAAGCHADALHRTLRALASQGVFVLLADGRFANNALSETLQAGRLKRSQEWVRYISSPSTVAAWADFDEVLRTGEAAFPRVHGQSVWTYYAAHPDEEALFAEAMMGLTVNDAPVVAGLYPFGEIQRLCDVGGGRGTLLSELLIRHPHLQGVLCDAPGVLALARELLDRRGVTARAELVAGNFFETVPAGYDAYLMKNVLHDWDDATCVRILQTVRRAMAADSRLLIVEGLVERQQATGFGPLADLQMMVVCDNGRERGREDYARLLKQAGMRMARVFSGPTIAVIEGRPE